jgi:hypothetical protein
MATFLFRGDRMSRDTQNARLIAYLKKHHFITRRTAARDLEIMNLWCRVAECEEEIGYKLDRRWTTTRTGKRVLQYWWRTSAQARKAA